MDTTQTPHFCTRHGLDIAARSRSTLPKAGPTITRSDSATSSATRSSGGRRGRDGESDNRQTHWYRQGIADPVLGTEVPADVVAPRRDRRRDRLGVGGSQGVGIRQHRRGSHPVWTVRSRGRSDSVCLLRDVAPDRHGTFLSVVCRRCRSAGSCGNFGRWRRCGPDGGSDHPCLRSAPSSCPRL